MTLNQMHTIFNHLTSFQLYRKTITNNTEDQIMNKLVQLIGLFKKNMKITDGWKPSLEICVPVK